MVNIWSLFSHAIGAGCPLCRAPGDGFCSACLAALPWNRIHCPVCALPLPAAAPANTLCATCQQRRPAFDRVVVAWRYEPPVDDLISRFKYHHGLHLGRQLADVLAAQLTGEPALPQLLVPVPAPAHRLAERGFNQAAELASRLSACLDIPGAGGRLARLTEPDHQRGATRGQRRRNVRGSFACRGHLPSHVAVIDDVVTTGATAHEIARVLRRKGVERIEVWALARTPMPGQTGR